MKNYTIKENTPVTGTELKQYWLCDSKKRIIAVIWGTSYKFHCNTVFIYDREKIIALTKEVFSVEN